MKSLFEFITIKNLNTDKVTTVDEEGNIEEKEPAFDEGGEFGEFDEFEDENANPFADDSDEFDGFDMGIDDEPMGDEAPMDDLTGEEAPLEGEGEFEENGMFGDEEDEGEQGDPDFQGVIRTVTGACLVYKRKDDEGTYEELWVYNVGKNMRQEVKTRRAILAGTDIPAQSVSSDDGTQEVETTTIGNAQFLRVTGLPN